MNQGTLGPKPHLPSWLSLWLLLLYVGLILYASLYPFGPWANPGLAFWGFVAQPLPLYWSGFDVTINILGYLPLGFLLGLRWINKPAQRFWGPFVGTLLLAATLSFAMEGLQTYLAPRVASNVDWFLNVLGAGFGVLLAWIAHGLGAVATWRVWRNRWVGAPSAPGGVQWGAGVGLSLLLLWGALLLYPEPVPFGMGRWFDTAITPLSPRLQVLSCATGLWMPLLLGFALMPQCRPRLVLMGLVFTAAVSMSAIATGLTYGGHNAWIWLREPVLWGLLLATWVGLVFSALLPRLGCWGLLVFVVFIHVLLMNLTPLDPYFLHHLSTWEAGRFVRFYGLTQWLSAAWPFAVFVLALLQLSKRSV